MVDSEIASLRLFAGLGGDAAARVSETGVTTVPAGQILAQAGDQGSGMFVVLDGTVTVERGNVHVDIEREGFFGELSLLVDHAPRVARVRAKTDARLIAIPRPTFDYLIDSEPSFSRELLKGIAAQLIEARQGR
jgi:CRP-like cAMP-binding protein